jgi:hypothetical protein
LVLKNESREEFEALAAAYRDEYNPQGATENHLVEDLVAAEWFQRRYLRIRNVLLDMIRDGETERLGRNPARTLALLDRFIGTHTRGYNRAATTLRKIQRERHRAVNAKLRNEPGKGLKTTESKASKRPIWLN